MPYVHEHPDWPRLFWDGEALSGALAAVRHKQGRLLGRMEALGFQVCAESSVSVLTSDVVKSSAIEGETLSAAEVRSSISRRLGLEAGAVRGREVEGIVEVMLDATRNFAEPLTRERLLGWHASLFRGARGMPVGAWRTDEPPLGPMRVVSGQIGRERVHFEAPGAERVEGEMARFLEWMEDGPERRDPRPVARLDPVLKAGVAHFWFVTIHPFEDGNGRIARAIADLCLARADGTGERFYSMSSQIAAERAEYYRRLESAQRGGPEITLWLEWFLGCLERAIDGAGALVGGVLRKARVWERANRVGVNERQRLVLNRLLDDFTGFLTTSKYAALAGCSGDTALRDIRELVERGILAANPGRGRSASYRLGE